MAGQHGFRYQKARRHKEFHGWDLTVKCRDQTQQADRKRISLQNTWERHRHLASLVVLIPTETLAMNNEIAWGCHFQVFPNVKIKLDIIYSSCGWCYINYASHRHKTQPDRRSLRGGSPTVWYAFSLAATSNSSSTQHIDSLREMGIWVRRVRSASITTWSTVIQLLSGKSWNRECMSWRRAWHV